MHDSYTALGGCSALTMILLGEVASGGVGSGLYGMLLFAVVAVFIAGLMVGRTPEYLGKKIEAHEMKMALLGMLIMPVGLLVTRRHRVGRSSTGRARPAEPGPHGFSEILYAFSSAVEQQRLRVRRPHRRDAFYNLVARHRDAARRASALIVPVLALAGSLAKQKTRPVEPGTLPTHTPLSSAC